MNHPARTFHRLMGLWHQDAGDDSVDVLAADFAAQVAGLGGLACVGLVQSDAVRRLFGLACFLDGYGLTLRQRYSQDRRVAFVFAEMQAPRTASEYDGAVVTERPRFRALERAA